MSVNPARILKINAGTLSVGANADVVLINPDEEWTVDAGKLHGKSKNTPFKTNSIFKNYLTAEDCLFDFTCESSAFKRGVFED